MGKKKRAKIAAEQGTFNDARTIFTPAPYVATSPTSKAAAEEIEPQVVNLKERVFDEIKCCQPCTDEMISEHTGLNPSTARPRRVELVRAGRVVQVGEGKTSSGRRAALWGLP